MAIASNGGWKNADASGLCGFESMFEPEHGFSARRNFSNGSKVTAETAITALSDAESKGWRQHGYLTKPHFPERQAHGIGR